MKRLVIALLLVSTPVGAHDARAAEVFTFSETEQVVAGGDRIEPGAVVSGFKADLEYADGHRESAAGQCTVRDNPAGAPFSRSGVCRAPGVYTMEFHCRSAGPASLDCWGSLTGALDGHHNGLTGLITYRSGPEGVAGAGRWND